MFTRMSRIYPTLKIKNGKQKGREEKEKKKAKHAIYRKKNNNKAKGIGKQSTNKFKTK